MDITTFSMGATFEILKGLLSQPIEDVELYADTKYSAEQMEQIRLGVNEGINVKLYADTKYSAEQMEQIRLGILEGLDVTKFTDESIDPDSMEVIRLAMKTIPDKVDYMLEICKTKCDKFQLNEIYLGLVEDVDVSKYSNPNNYDSDQMRIIREALLENWDVEPITSTYYTASVMRLIKDYWKVGFDVRGIVDAILETDSTDSGDDIDSPKPSFALTTASIIYIVDLIMYDIILEEISGDHVHIDVIKRKLSRYFRTCALIQNIGFVPTFTDEFKAELRGKVIRL